MTITNKREGYFERGLLLRRLPPFLRKLLRFSAFFSPDQEAARLGAILLRSAWAGAEPSAPPALWVVGESMRGNPRARCQGERCGVVCGQPAAKTPLLSLLGIRAQRRHPTRSPDRGLCKGPISCKGGWRNCPAKVVMNYRTEEGGGGPRISYV